MSTRSNYFLFFKERALVGKVGLCLVFVSVVFLISGCVVVNLNPLYREKDLVSTPDLSGSWTTNDEDHGKGILTFFKNTNGTYETIEIDKSDKQRAKYLCGLVKLKGQFFLDVKIIEGGDAYKSFINSRLIARITFHNDKFKMEFLDEDWLKEQLATGKLKIAHVLKDDDLILTAPTPDLQRFISGIAEDKNAFPAESNYFYRLN